MQKTRDKTKLSPAQDAEAQPPLETEGGCSQLEAERAAADLRPATRQRILQAALETLAERHLAHTRLRHIAEKAGLHYGNLHYYFHSKNELYLALLDTMLQPITCERKAMAADPGISPTQKLDTLLQRNQELIERGVELRVILDFLVQSSGSAPVRRKLQAMYRDWRGDVEAIIRQGVEQGEFHPADADLLPLLVVSLIEGYINQYLLDPGVSSPKEYFAGLRSALRRLLEG
jgi:AcrR family transcriptional regulator